MHSFLIMMVMEFLNIAVGPFPFIIVIFIPEKSKSLPNFLNYFIADFQLRTLLGSSLWHHIRRSPVLSFSTLSKRAAVPSSPALPLCHTCSGLTSFALTLSHHHTCALHHFPSCSTSALAFISSSPHRPLHLCNKPGVGTYLSLLLLLL